MTTTQAQQAEAPAYDPQHYANLIRVEDRHFWFKARNHAITTMFGQIKQHLEPGYKVLEVGCGTGNVLRALQRSASGGTVIGMDLHQEGLRYAQRRVDPALLVVGDAAHPPFDVKFQVVGAFDVIEHIDDDVGVLRQLREILGARGMLLLTVPADPKLWSYFDVAANHRRRYVAKELEAKLVAAGFSIEYLTYYMALLHPLVWAGRRFAGWRYANSESLEADLRVRPVSGAVLGFLLDQEIRLLKRRRRLPIGTSLLAIARRS